MDRHSNTSSTGLVRTVLPGSDDLALAIDLVELEDRELDLLVLVVLLLWLGVDLLLSLLRTTTQSQNKMKSRFLLNVVIRERSSIFQLLSSKDQTLLIRRNSFLILDLLFDIINRIRWFHIKSDGLSGECLHKDLHLWS